MSEMMVCFTCCVTQQPHRKRPTLDRSMIGYPTDFRHTGHIGSGEVSEASNQLGSVQTQMSSKGGYDHVSPVSVQLNVIEVQKAY